ncbi:MAG: hypothetical protein CMB99_07280 [Flavobacteriaceae bacterium]|nr:hypothetical protein [Flavobacteriaceae bacterium]|tara:strand:- start:29950 stop:30783 length:834 start_codon:yes stop_codon:yes gene_type:complete
MAVKTIGKEYMIRKNKIASFLCILLLGIAQKSYGQTLFEKYGERSYVETIDLPMLKIISGKLQIPFSNINLKNSQSIEVSPDLVFFTIQYMYKTTVEGKFFTSKYILVNKKDEKIIQHFNDKNDYGENDAVQVYSSNILMNKIQIGPNDIGIGVIAEEYVKSRVTLFSRELFSIIKVSEKGLSMILENYPISKSSGEQGIDYQTFEQETLETQISTLKSTTNGFFDLQIQKTFRYESKLEGKPEKGHGSEKQEMVTLKFNGQFYEFTEDNRFRFLGW